MADIELPGKSLIKAYQTGGEVSMAAAGAPAAAAAQVGGEIQQLGERGMALVTNLRQADTRTKANAMELALLKDQAEYENEMLRADPKEWYPGYQKRVEELKKRFVPEGMSPDEQAAIGNRFEEITTKGGVAVGRQAALAVLQNDRTAAGNLLQFGEVNDDEDVRSRALSQMKSLGYGSAEIERVTVESNRRVAVNRIERQINENPLEWNAKLKSGDSLKEFPGLGPDDLPRLQSKAREAARVSTGVAIDEFQDKLATDEIKTPDEIDRAFKNRVSPSVVEGMKATLSNRHTAEEKARLKSPAVQAQMTGEVSRIMDGITSADVEDFESRYSQAAFTLSKLEDSPEKVRLTERLRATKSGREEEVKNHKDAAFKALDAYDKRERARIPVAEKMRTARAIADGYLANPKKLEGLGWTEGQAKEIASEDDDTKRRAKFRELWDKRPNKATTDTLTWKTAEAILGGSENVDYISPEAEDSAITAQLDADRKAGERQMKLSEFLKVNPEATPQQVDDKILEIGGEQTHRELKSGIYESMKSNTPKGADPSTSSIPMGKDLKTIVKHFEAGGAAGGFHRTAYWDYGQWSIGYGTKSKEGEVIDQAEAEKRLDAELASHRKRVEDYAAKVGLKLAGHELDALTSFDYNTGRIEQLTDNGKRSKAEIASAMLLYRNADGQRLAGLERRRQAEQTLFLKGYTA